MLEPVLPFPVPLPRLVESLPYLAFFLSSRSIGVSASTIPWCGVVAATVWVPKISKQARLHDPYPSPKAFGFMPYLKRELHHDIEEN
ncbi:hypothetical protein ACH5RR_009392 [Cinchona calisaya]|uniref:Uncharacterized protein n=1 Tax=Cinchona calisaya TaxID=153742 RepID=A0ABD3AHJ2_9GENT